MLEPVLTPAELWETSGRIGIPIVFKLKDRTGRDFVLPFSHEETMTFHARELQSYKQLPQFWYHFSTKERDEPRARGGLLRLREFIMKDSYSFDRDEAGLDKSFDAHKQAYERILERCGLAAYHVAAESGLRDGRRASRARADPRRRPAERGEARDGTRRGLPADDGRGDQSGLRRRRRLPRTGRGNNRRCRGRGVAGWAVRGGRKPGRLASARC